MNVTTHTISGDNTGINEILNTMVAVIRTGPQSPLVIRTARMLARSSQQQTAINIKFFLKRVCRYVDDPLTEEHLEDADALLRVYALTSEIPGDCDEVAILGGSLALAVNIPVTLTAIAFAPQTLLSHVFATLHPNDSMLPVDLDITRPSGGIPAVAASMTVEV